MLSQKATLSFFLPSLVIFLLVSVVVISSVAVPVYSQVNQPRMGGTFVIGTARPLGVFSPLVGSTDESRMVAANIYPMLVRLDTSLNPHPYLADSWTVSADGLTWTFKLVHNALWSDGVPVTAKDVAFSYNNMNNKGVYAGNQLRQTYSNVQAIDNYTVAFKLKHPAAYFIVILGSIIYGAVFPEHIWKNENFLNSTYNLHPVSAGPFKVSDVQTDKVTLVRDTNFWLWKTANRPYLDQIILKVYPDVNGLIAALRAGEVNYAPIGLPTSLISSLKGDPNLKFDIQNSTKLTGHLYTLFFNNDNPILKDPNMRKAIYSAIDRQTINSNVFLNTSTTANSVFQPSSPFYDPNVSIFPYNLTAAKAFLAKTSHPNGGFSLDVYFTSGKADDLNVAQIIKQNLAQLNINLVLNPGPFSSYSHFWLNGGNFSTSLNFFTVPPFPDWAFNTFFGNSTLQKGVSLQYGFHALNVIPSNTTLLSLENQALQTSDQTQQVKLYAQAQELAASGVAYAFLTWAGSLVVWNANYYGLLPGPSPSSVDPMDGVWWSGGTPISLTTTQSTTTQSTPAPTVGSNYLLIAAIVAVAIVLISLGSYYVRRRRT